MYVAKVHIGMLIVMHTHERKGTQGWRNQHFISQASIAFVVLNVLILKIICQTCKHCMVRQWSDLPRWLPFVLIWVLFVLCISPLFKIKLACVN